MGFINLAPGSALEGDLLLEDILELLHLLVHVVSFALRLRVPIVSFVGSLAELFNGRRGRLKYVRHTGVAELGLQLQSHLREAWEGSRVLTAHDETGEDLPGGRVIARVVQQGELVNGAPVEEARSAMIARRRQRALRMILPAITARRGRLRHLTVHFTVGRILWKRHRALGREPQVNESLTSATNPAAENEVLEIALLDLVEIHTTLRPRTCH